MEGLERGVVEADKRTDGSGRFVNLGLSIQLRPLRAEDLHLGEEVSGRETGVIFLLSQSFQDSVELVE